LALGVGWRPELAELIAEHDGLGFVEVIAENTELDGPVADALDHLRVRGVQVVPHGVRLSLGGADRPDPRRLARLARLAERFDSPLVSEHIAFARAGPIEAGHVMPVPHTRETLEILVENVGEATAALRVPLALEHVASLVRWPEDELDQGAFVAELLERTGTALLLDLANLYADATNHGVDAQAALAEFPLRRLAYVHVAGGELAGGLYHDTQAAPVPPAVLELVGGLRRLTEPPGVMLERDDAFPSADEWRSELNAIGGAMGRAAAPPPG